MRPSGPTATPVGRKGAGNSLIKRLPEPSDNGNGGENVLFAGGWTPLDDLMVTGIAIDNILWLQCSTERRQFAKTT